MKSSYPCALGFMGLRMDQGKGPKRWNKWRPSVSLALQREIPFAAYHLLYPSKEKEPAKRMMADLEEASPEMQVFGHEMDFEDPWEFESVYSRLHSFSKSMEGDLERADLYIHMTTGTHVQQICLFLLADRGYLPGKLIQSIPLQGKEGDPVGRHMVVDLNLENYSGLRSGLRLERMGNLSFLKSGIETRNSEFNHTIEYMERVALRSREPILITGPTGAGKSRLAKQIFELKKQRHQIQGEFVELNCGTLMGDAAMSTLFGHVKGAFTGAMQARKGLLSEANGGILFLDEIGELGIDEQTMLLTALETKAFRPVGSDQPQKSEFMLMAGTNQDLAKRISEGKFRSDLLARINQWTFDLPALKDRPEDIEPNLDYELNESSKKLGHRVALDFDARKLYMKEALRPESSWQNNFRDLNASVMRMGTLAEAGLITVQDVKEEWKRLRKSWGERSESDKDEGSLLRHFPELEQLDPFERITLEGTLRFVLPYKSMSEAGRQLYSISRLKRKSQNDGDRLKKYLGKYNLGWGDVLKVASLEAGF